MKRLWIDDLRPPPDDDDVWDWAKSSAEAFQLMDMQEYDEISFDHDLGGDDTSMPVARFIEEQAHEGKAAPPKWTVHSANPVGRDNLKATLASADAYWERWETKADWE